MIEIFINQKVNPVEFSDKTFVKVAWKTCQKNSRIIMIEDEIVVKLSTQVIQFIISEAHVVATLFLTHSSNNWKVSNISERCHASLHRTPVIHSTNCF